eukprot:8577130-Pyramimonas_sp.AAC.1
MADLQKPRQAQPACIQQFSGHRTLGGHTRACSRGWPSPARSPREHARIRPESMSALFVDLVAAFHRAVREILVRFEGEEEITNGRIAHLLHASGPPPSCMESFAAELAKRPLQEELEVPAHLGRVLAETSTGTRATTPGSGLVALMTTGARPGNTLAAQLFLFIVSGGGPLGQGPESPGTVRH